jgi:hypothetical protein
VLLSSSKITSTDTAKHIFTLRITAQEYTNGNIQKTCFFDVPFIFDPYEIQVQFDIRLIDNNGLFSTCWIFYNITDLGNVAHICTPKLHKDKDRSHYCLLSYDVYHTQFIMQCFGEGLAVVDDNVQLHLPSVEFHEYSQVWANQMLTPIIDVGSTSRHFIFQIIKAFDQISNEHPSVRYMSGIKDSLQTTPDKDLTGELRTGELKGPMDWLISYFTYEAETRPYQEPWTDVSWSRNIRGDETFWVLSAESCYAVFCFDKRVVLPSINQLSKEYLVYQP